MFVNFFIVTGSAENNLKSTNLYFEFGFIGYIWVSFAHYCCVKKKKILKGAFFETTL